MTGKCRPDRLLLVWWKVSFRRKFLVIQRPPGMWHDVDLARMLTKARMVPWALKWSGSVGHD